MYDGLYTAYATGVSSSTAEADVMSQRIRGFYKSAGTSARITHIVGTGGNNQTEKITVQSSQADDQYRPTAEFERSVSTDESEFGPLMGESHVQPHRAEPVRNTGAISRRSDLRRDRDDNGQREQYESGCVSSLGRHNLQYRSCGRGSRRAPRWPGGCSRPLTDPSVGLKDPDGTGLPNLHAMGAASHP